MLHLVGWLNFGGEDVCYSKNRFYKMNDLLVKTVVSAVCVLLIHLGQTAGEVFTSIAEMEELLKTEAHFLSNLDSFIAYEEEKINFLKR